MTREEKIQLIKDLEAGKIQPKPDLSKLTRADLKFMIAVGKRIEEIGKESLTNEEITEIQRIDKLISYTL